MKNVYVYIIIELLEIIDLSILIINNFNDIYLNKILSMKKTHCKQQKNNIEYSVVIIGHKHKWFKVIQTQKNHLNIYFKQIHTTAVHR